MALLVRAKLYMLKGNILDVAACLYVCKCMCCELVGSECQLCCRLGLAKSKRFTDYPNSCTTKSLAHQHSIFDVAAVLANRICLIGCNVCILVNVHGRINLTCREQT